MHFGAQRPLDLRNGWVIRFAHSRFDIAASRHPYSRAQFNFEIF
jgi:hypothetical protein